MRRSLTATVCWRSERVCVLEVDIREPGGMGAVADKMPCRSINPRGGRLGELISAALATAQARSARLA